MKWRINLLFLVVCMFLLANMIQTVSATTDISSETNIAFNPSRVGYPSPLESDHGWGGGSDKWDIVDGLRDYTEWYNGLAFTGGINNWAGETGGLRQATINFGDDYTFDKVIIWHHGTIHIPGNASGVNLQYWNGSDWTSIDFQRNVNLSYQTTPGYAGVTPDTLTFASVTGSKVRYSFDNTKLNILGTQIEHGWIYEFEVYGHGGNPVDFPEMSSLERSDFGTDSIEINFDELSSGTIVGNSYESKGLLFENAIALAAPFYSISYPNVIQANGGIIQINIPEGAEKFGIQIDTDGFDLDRQPQMRAFDKNGALLGIINFDQGPDFVGMKFDNSLIYSVYLCTIGYGFPIDSPNISSSDSYDNLILENQVSTNSPQLVPIGSKSVKENELLTFNISATDTDGDAITYSATNLPTGANFDAATATFTWTPDTGSEGIYNVTFIATANSQNDSETITITVSDWNPWNDPSSPEGNSITLSELQEAIYDWRFGISLSTGQMLSLARLQGLIYSWRFV